MPSAGIVSAIFSGMKQLKPIALWCAAAVTLGLVALPPSGSCMAAPDDQALVRLVAEIAEQHTKIANNQQLIDQKIAVIEESLRVARIYVSRGGAKK